jgi:putative addiction module antidote
MLYEAKIRPIGSSKCIILSKEILDDLNAKEGETLHLRKNENGKYEIDTHKSDIDEQMKIALEGMERYKNALRELANR